eukprot:6456465-Amphidinium_carterae.1
MVKIVNYCGYGFYCVLNSLQLHGHMLRHTPGFHHVLSAVSTSTLHLNRLQGGPPLLRQGRPIRYNGLYLQLHDDSYMAYAGQRSRWTRMARTSTQHVLNALALSFTNSGWQRRCRKNGILES